MGESFVHAVAIFAVVNAGFALVLMVQNRSVTNGLFYAASILEATLIALLVIGIIAVIRTDRPVESGLLVTYLVTLIVIPPAAVLWAIAEKSRWGTGTLVVALLTVAILCERAVQIWTQ